MKLAKKRSAAEALSDHASAVVPDSLVVLEAQQTSAQPAAKRAKHKELAPKPEPTKRKAATLSQPLRAST